MKFTKFQATGNDFILIDARGLERNWAELAKVMCRRRFGVGADGLILVLESEKADFRMREFNPDGSEAEACGNGLRCFAKWVIDKRLIEGTKLKVETLGGIREAEAELSQGKVTSVWVGMGSPRFAPAEIPARVAAETPKPILNYPVKVGGQEIKVSLVSMGNPHAVSFLSEPVSEFPLSKIGPEMENHPLFPNRINFEIVNVESRDIVKARVWERGVGETLSCGSGACAIAVVAKLLEMVTDKVKIKLPGGMLEVEWDGKGEVRLGGPAEMVFEGEWLT